MIDRDTEAQIVRLHLVEKWPPGTIARQLGLHHGVVRRVLLRVGVPTDTLVQRRSIVDPYRRFIAETLEKYPDLPASRLHQMVRERGYPGRADHFRSLVRRVRPKPAAEAFLRLRALPGEQAQVDWAAFGKVPVEGGQRPLVAFVMVLSCSRMIFLRFGLSERMGAFLDGHAAAFTFFGGVPRVLLYDNLKSAVTERIGDVVRFNDTLLSFAGHHGYEPRPCAPYRGNEKGRVERAIRYVRDNFMPARTWRDLDDLNAQARAWCLGVAAERRCPEDRLRTVGQVFSDERARLRLLPENPFPVEDVVAVEVGKTPYARFDGNDYSLPHDHVRRTLTVQATLDTVRLLNGTEEIARHVRCWARGRQIEDPAHLAALVAEKRRASEARGLDRLAVAVPPSRELLARLAERGGNLGSATAALLQLLDGFGAAALIVAVEEALAHDRPHPHAVRQILDRRRQEAGRAPPVAVELPNDPRVRHLAVRPHALASYDRMGGDDDER